MRIALAFLLLAIVISLAGCAGQAARSADGAKGILQTLEFDPDECGSFTGHVSISPPISGVVVTATLEKFKSCEGITE